MINIRTGSFGLYRDNYYELIDGDKSICQLINRGSITHKLKLIGFKEYSNQIQILQIPKIEIKAAYQVYTYCEYNGFKYQVTDNLENEKLRIRPLQEAQNHLRDFQKHGYDPVFEVEVNKILTIWEEREPFLDFPLKIETLKYLKGFPVEPRL